MQTESLLISFLEDADQVCYNNEKFGIKAAWNDILGNEVEKYKLSVSMSIQQLLDVYALATSITETIAIPTLEKIKSGNLTLTGDKLKLLDYTEIETIRPEYLKEYLKDLTDFVAKNMQDDSKAIRFCKELSSGEFNAAFKKKMVPGKLSPYMKSKDMVNNDFIPVPFDAPTVHKYFIPFLEDYINDKAVAGVTSHGFGKIVKAIKDLKSYIEKEMEILVETISTTETIQKGTATRVAYVVVASYTDVFKYLVAGSIRYICNYTRNVRNIGEFVKSISHTESDPLLEKVEAAFEDGDSMEFSIGVDKLSDMCEKVIERFKCDGISPTEEYSKRTFDLPIKLIENYTIKLIKFLNHLVQHPEQTLHEIADECELNNPKAWSVLNGEYMDEKFLVSTNFDSSYLLGDVMMIRSRIFDLPKLIDERPIKTIEEIKERIQSNVNDEIPDSVRREDAISFLNKIEDDLDKAKGNMLRAFAQRLNFIVNEVPAINALNDEIVKDTDNSFFADAHRLVMDIIEESADDEISRMMRDYQGQYIRQISGAFFEAEGDNNQNASGGTQPSENTESQNTQGEEKKDPSKPQVTDNDAQNSSGNQNASNNNQNGENGDDKTTFTQKLKDALNKIITSIKEFIKGKGAVNMQSLNFHRNYLMTRSYANISVDVLPYQKRNYADMLSKFMDAALAISDQNLKTMSQEQIANALFASVSYASAKPGDDKGDPITSKLENAIAVGATAKVTKKFSNGEVKALVNDMIAYVESYYGDNGIASALEKINLDKLSAMDNKKGSGDGDKTTENVTFIKTSLTKAILATKNVCRNRCNDYMTVLQTIWANDPAGKATGNKGNTENTTQPTQNDQNQNNQNQQDNNAT